MNLVPVIGTSVPRRLVAETPTAADAFAHNGRHQLGAIVSVTVTVLLGLGGGPFRGRWSEPRCGGGSRAPR